MEFEPCDFHKILAICASPSDIIASKAVLLNRGAHGPLGGEFEILRGEILKRGNWG